MQSSIVISMAAWIFEVSFQASVVATLILAAQWVFRRRLSAGVCYALWFLLLIRLALPLSPQSAVSVFNLTRAKRSLPERTSPPPSAVADQARSPAAAPVVAASSSVSEPQRPLL